MRNRAEMSVRVDAPTLVDRVDRVALVAVGRVVAMAAARVDWMAEDGPAVRIRPTVRMATARRAAPVQAVPEIQAGMVRVRAATASREEPARQNDRMAAIAELTGGLRNKSNVISRAPSALLALRVLSGARCLSAPAIVDYSYRAIDQLRNRCGIARRRQAGPPRSCCQTD